MRPLFRWGKWAWVGVTRPGRSATLASIVALLAVTLWAVPTPYYVTTPGPAYPTTSMVQVQGGQSGSSEGVFLMLTISSEPANVIGYVYGRVHPQARLEHRQQFLGPYTSYREYQRVGEIQMADSHKAAAAAAEKAMGYPAAVRPLGVRVLSLTPESPNQGRLAAGDVITAIDGTAVSTPAQLTQALGVVIPGTIVRLVVERDDQSQTLAANTVAHPSRPGAAVGALIEAAVEYELPVPVTVESSGVIGPSAGLTFALEIAEQLTDEDLARGRRIAATGTVSADGRVGPVGGVAQKAVGAERAGASMMLVAEANHAEAAAAVRNLTVVPVATVSEAVEWLRK